MNEPPNYLHLTKSIILENRPAGSVVGDLVATDPDVRNTKLTFMVKSPANSPFGIGGVLNHTLVTTRLLDYETTKQQDILISVTDDGGLSLEKFFTIKTLSKFMMFRNDIILFIRWYENKVETTGHMK